MRWAPFADVRQAMDRVLEESFRPLRVLRGYYEEIAPVPLDIHHTANDVVIKASLPGVKAIKIKPKGVIEAEKK